MLGRAASRAPESALTGISLFSGCGGLDLGAQTAGVAFTDAFEKDPFCRAGHQQLIEGCNFHCLPVEKVDAFRQADVLTAGYPCQSFSLGGARRPGNDPRSLLYLQVVRALCDARPSFFIAENVVGLRGLERGRLLTEHLVAFSNAGAHGYNLAVRVIRAEQYGVPQRRRRLFIIGVRRDMGLHYWFPPITHGPPTRASARLGLEKWMSHGDAVADMPLWPSGEFYERPEDLDKGFSWYYMSRNRKAGWDDPSFTVLANWRHTTLHPASPAMRMAWSDLGNGWKQRWEFSHEYDHLIEGEDRPTLPAPRRLSWRECAQLQTFPKRLEPDGPSRLKMRQIGDAVPPRLAESILRPLFSSDGLRRVPSPDSFLDGRLPTGFMPKPRVRPRVPASS